MPDVTDADVTELVDVPDLGSGVARRGGSSPLIRTIQLLGCWCFSLKVERVMRPVLGAGPFGPSAHGRAIHIDTVSASRAAFEIERQVEHRTRA